MFTAISAPYQGRSRHRNQNRQTERGRKIPLFLTTPVTLLQTLMWEELNRKPENINYALFYEEGLYWWSTSIYWPKTTAQPLLNSGKVQRIRLSLQSSNRQLSHKNELIRVVRLQKIPLEIMKNGTLVRAKLRSKHRRDFHSFESSIFDNLVLIALSKIHVSCPGIKAQMQSFSATRPKIAARFAAKE
jgi:hypothetical protein